MGVVAGWARGLAAAAADARGTIAASDAGFDAGLKEVALGVGGTRALATPFTTPLGLAEGVAGALTTVAVGAAEALTEGVAGKVTGSSSGAATLPSAVTAPLAAAHRAVVT